MNWQSAKRLLSDTEGYPVSVSCENDTVYTNFETQHSVRLESWEQLVKQNLLRIVLYKAPQKLLKRLAVTSYSGLYIQPLEHSDILAVSQSATKEQALKTLLEYWKLTSEEVISFGDDINDLGFLSLVGTGVTTYKSKRFSTFTNDLRRCATWLSENHCKDVCMESTGKYWIPVYNILEDTCTIVLAHPKYVKAIRGKKTDRKDAKWIADIFKHDLVSGSFIPPADIRQLRDLMRYH